jgi:hypothetical protein
VDDLPAECSNGLLRQEHVVEVVIEGGTYLMPVDVSFSRMTDGLISDRLTLNIGMRLGESRVNRPHL